MNGLIPTVMKEGLLVAYQKAMGFCTSAQLRRHMTREILLETPQAAKGQLFVPEYWAIYYHIGRANMPLITARNKKYLAWFPDKRDDPRLINGEYPIFKSDVVGLRDVMSKEEFKAAIKEGKLVLSEVSPRSGAAKFRGNPFFGSAPGEGLADMKERMDSIARRETSRAMERFLKETGLKHKKITKLVYVRGVK